MIRKYLLTGVILASPAGMREALGAAWAVC